MSENQTAQPFTTPPVEKKQSPAAQPIRNVKDLIVLLGELQERIEQLETENRGLKADLARKITKKETAAMLSQLDQFRLPKLGLFSDSFFLRAISIYGHWLTAHLVVTILLSLISFVILITVGQNLVENILNMPY